jgi:hypothetical protein
LAQNSDSRKNNGSYLGRWGSAVQVGGHLNKDGKHQSQQVMRVNLPSSKMTSSS